MVRYQRPVKDEVDPYKAAPLPVDRPAAVYYRQSTEAQMKLSSNRDPSFLKIWTSLHRMVSG